MDINAALLERINMTREEAIGRSCYELINHQETPCSLDDLECPFKTARETGKPSRATHVYRGEDKEETYLAVSCYPLVQKKEIAGAVNISRDITQEINMQKVMMQQEKLVSIGRLSAGVAHEINNPLTTILTTAILVQEDMVKDDPLYQELETIAKETLRCRKIVKSLLDFARQSPPAKKLHDVNAIVSESFLLTKKQAAFNNVELEMNLAANLPPIYLDKDQIQQAVMNLTLNAIEATSSRGKVIVETRNKSEQERIEISVLDNGIGIVSENLSKIFEHIMYNRIDKFIDEYNLIYDLQFGFRKKHSTNHALLSIVEKSETTWIIVFFHVEFLLILKKPLTQLNIAFY